MKPNTGVILMASTPRLGSIQRVLESSQEETCRPNATFLFWSLSSAAGYGELGPWLYLSSVQLVQLVPVCTLVLSRPVVVSVGQIQCSLCGVCGRRCCI